MIPSPGVRSLRPWWALIDLTVVHPHQLQPYRPSTLHGMGDHVRHYFERRCFGSEHGASLHQAMGFATDALTADKLFIVISDFPRHIVSSNE